MGPNAAIYTSRILRGLPFWLAATSWYFWVTGCQDSVRQTCEPGATQPCLCIGGVDGVQTCADDGAWWGDCQCEDCRCDDADGDADCDADADGDADADADGDSDIPGFDVRLHGAVDKGPFVVGSLVSLSLVDARGNPTGEVFNTHTINDLGEFNLELRVPRYASLEANGYYYNEATGALSESPIFLMAFYEARASGQQQAYINIVTHLSYGRVRSLLLAGADFDTAISQGEHELRLALGVGPPDFDPGRSGIDMNILGGDTDANAYLFAVSAVLANAARNRDGWIDAELQELVNGLSEDLEDDGELAGTAIAELRAAEATLDPDAVMSMLESRLIELGSTVGVPDIRRIIDRDDDGYVSADDCDDEDPEIFPGAPERCNALDDDCDGIVPEDSDGDGAADEDCGGDDCDDGNPDRFPRNIETCDDEIDQDCDGEADNDPCFVRVSAGTFTMGAPLEELGRWDYELQHDVTLTRDFEILSTEVTQADFDSLMGYNPSHFIGCGEDCPVETVNWHEAAAYCNALSNRQGSSPCYECTGSGASVSCVPSTSFATPYECPGTRLPTEAEWEYAARAGTTTTTYAGDLEEMGCSSEVLRPIAWYCGTIGDRTRRVGTLEPSPWGLYDVLGNVWEWCHDWYDDYPVGHAIDPTGPPAGANRVLRGASWLNLARDVRAAHRYWDRAAWRGDRTGFRPVRAVAP